jgi:hypothetical protein
VERIMSDASRDRAPSSSFPPQRPRGRIARVVGSIVIVLLGVWAVLEGRSLGLIEFGLPAPGLLPFFFGVLLILVSLLSLVEEFLFAAPEPTLETWEEDGEESSSMVACYLGVALCWTLAMLWIGFVAASFAALFVLVKVVERSSWTAALGVAAGGSLVAWLLFARLLGIPLP